MDTEELHDILQQEILGGERRPGDVVSERKLAAEMGLSRTRVREALLQLQHEGFVEVSGQQGNIVRRWSIADIRARYAMRAAIEVIAAEWAAENMTPALHRCLRGICDEADRLLEEGEDMRVNEMDRKFHATLVRAAQNREITRACSLLGFHGTIFELGDHAVDRKSSKTHRQLANLLFEQRVPEAKALLSEHIKGAEEELIARLEEEYANADNVGLAI